MRKFRVSVVALLALASALTLSPTAAAARTGPFRYVHRSAVVRRGKDFSLTVPCPAGTKVVGAGGKASDAFLLGVHVDFVGNDAHVGGENPTRTPQRISASAVCFTGSTTIYAFQTTSPLANGFSGGPGLGCSPTTLVAIGGGAGFTGPTFSRLRFTASTRVVNNVGVNFWEGSGDNRSGTTQNIQVETACVAPGTFTVVQPTRTRAVRPGRTATVKVMCPRGTHVSDGGFDLPSGALRVSAPVDGPDGDRVPDDGWKVRAKNFDRSPENLTVFAVCIR